MTRHGGHRYQPHPLDVARDVASQEPARKSIPLPEETYFGQATTAFQAHLDLPPALPSHETSFASTAVGIGENLRRLDSVIHDFIACLDRVHPPALEGSESANIARFRQILVCETPPNSPRLGPPVLCGMSPPIGLESVLGFLGSMRKTGILRVRADEATFMISVVEGDVVHGLSDPRPEEDLLGNILVKQGAIDEDNLRRFFEVCGSSPGRIGEYLDRQELVTTEQLRDAVEVQLQNLFDRLLATRSSEWCFHDGEAALSLIKLRLNATSVLLESARKRDEQSFMRS